jgi:t-SNARE complex subunit (syntaxin)
VKKIYTIFIFALVISFGQFAYAQPYTGFIDGSIWYSQTPKVEGESVDIHTAIWNGNDSEITVHVEFYDSNTLLGGRDIKIAKESLVDVHIPWKVTAGDHSISAKITKSSSIVAGSATSTSITSNQTDSFKITILKKSAVESGATEPIETITKKMSEALPAQVAIPATNVINKIDDFRSDTGDEIDSTISDVKDRITEISNKSAKPATEKSTKASTNVKEVKTETKNSLSGTEKPIAYVELFFLTIASYIFHQKILFYGIAIIIAFFVLKFFFKLILRR